MDREPFPKPGERLVDSVRPREASEESRPPRPISIVGSIGYGPAHPSWWAGRGGNGFSRLTIEDDSILMKPPSVAQSILRLPVVRLPLDDITSASRTTFGIWFHVPGDPALDGARFTPFGGDRGALKPLVEFLEAQGVPVDTMPVSTRVKKSFENGAVSMRPGFFFRDRGGLGFIEFVVVAAVGLTLMLVVGGFSHAPGAFLVFLAVIVLLNVLLSIVGAWRRKKALAAYRTNDPRVRSS
jgi:hypothetical protein